MTGDLPTWRLREQVIRQARQAIEGRANFEHHVGRRSTKPLTKIELDPYEVLQLLEVPEAGTVLTSPCGHAVYCPEHPPAEVPVGTWLRDRHGAVELRREAGYGQPGTVPMGKWPAMWAARGPYVVTGPWGLEPRQDA